MKFKIKASNYKYVVYDSMDAKYSYNNGYWKDNGDVTKNIDEAGLFDSLQDAIAICEDTMNIDLEAAQDNEDVLKRTYTIKQVTVEDGQVNEVRTALVLKTSDYL